MKKIIFPLLVMILTLTACQSIPRGYDSPQSLPPVGSIIELNQPLTVPSNSTRVYIQDGSTRNFDNVDIHYPSCHFFLHQHPRDLDRPRTIQADRFTIIESYTWEEVFLASNKVSASMTVSMADGDGTATQWNLSTIMKLQSEKQPQVVRLKCSIFDYPDHFNYLSVEQIIKALGNIATLHLNK